MNQGNLSDNIFDLVALQMADHVPADVGRELLHFIAQFLHFIFSEIADALPVDFLQHFQRFCFADSDESHFLRISSRPAAGIFNMLSYFFQLIFYHIVFLPYWYSSCPSSTMEASNTMWSYTDKPYFMFFRTV